MSDTSIDQLEPNLDATAELAGLLHGVSPRADLGADAAWSVDLDQLDALLARVPAPSGEALLRLGHVWLTRGRRAEARAAFEQVSDDARARWNLALVELAEGARPSAVDCPIAVPARFTLETLRMQVGDRVWIDAREGDRPVTLELGERTRAIGPVERERFLAAAKPLIGLEHPGLITVLDGFVEGRTLGLVTARQADRTLASTSELLSLEQALALLDPVFDALIEHGLVHAALHPRHLVIEAGKAKLRGFGLPPLVHAGRLSQIRDDAGYLAPQGSSDGFALAAALFHCLTGRAPSPGQSASAIVATIDPRVDELLARAMAFALADRPTLAELRGELATILSTPRPLAQAGSGAVPVAIAHEPSTALLREPEDPNDIEAWGRLLERKPNHLPAREAIARIERESRAQDRWDQVAEVLALRAKLSQAEGEKILLLRELAEVCERRLSAPGTALDAYLELIGVVSVATQLALFDDVLRLAGVTGRWAPVADKLLAIGKRLPKPADQVRVLGAVGRIYAEEIGEVGKAKRAYEAAIEIEPENLGLQRAMLVVQRKSEDPAEIAHTLLTLAELEQGSARHDALLEAAELLEQLGEHEGALEAADHARVDEPNDPRALAIVERCARTLEQWSLVATVLAAQADAALGDREAGALRREAAELLRKQGDTNGAIAQYRRLIERNRDDRTAAKTLVELLRAKLGEGDGAGAISAREGLIDALSVLAETSDDTGERVELLAEIASLLDREADGGERAADCRERILASVPIDHPRVGEAVAGLTRWYRSQDDWSRLAELLDKRARTELLGKDARAAAWRELWELLRSEGPLADEARERKALEQLAELEPENPRWRDLLIAGLMEQGDQDRAEALMRQRIEQAAGPRERAAMLLSVARMRERAGEREQAEAKVREVLELADDLGEAWELLAELLEARERPIEAIEARTRAAQHASSTAAKISGLFAAAQTWITRLERIDRGLPLLEQVVELDPNHAAATALLVDVLVARGELANAWPHAQRRVGHVRAHTPDDRPANAQALALAGRCALAVEQREQARELLRRAKELDPRNREVTKALAQLELESGHFEDALKAFQALALQGGEMKPSEQSALYLDMARARRGMNEQGKAAQMVERALDLDPNHLDAIRFLVELHAGDPVRKVEAEQRLIKTIEAQVDAMAGDDSRRATLEQELLDRRLELATTLADKLNRPREAVAQMQAVIERRGSDISLLHRALDLFTHAEQWADAVGLLDRLAAMQESSAVQAKYRYAAAVTLRDHGLDPRPNTGESEFRKRLLAVLEADPQHEKAGKALEAALEAASDWAALSKLLRGRLKSLPESTEPEVRVALLDRIGDLYETKLGDRQTALIAFEQAIGLAPASSDAQAMAARRERVINLAVVVGGDALDKALTQVQAMVETNPLDYDNYHRLVELYLAAKQRDAAIAVARTLRFLKQADEAEVELAEELGENFRPARGTLSRKHWRDVLLATNPQLSDLYGLIWPVMAAREAQTHAKLGVDRNARETVSLQSSGIARWVAFVAQVLDMPPPELYVRKGTTGDFVVAAPGDAQGYHPTLVAGDDALGKQPDAALAFRVGRALARVHPHLLAAALLPSSSSLRDAIYGAVALTHPQVAIPKELREGSKTWSEAIGKVLPPSRLDELKKGVGRVIERGGADTKLWLKAVDHSAARVGFLLADSLDVSARVILQGGAGMSTEGRELIKGLVAFSVSGPYLAARRSLKLG
ncbi:hypothetical protein ACNOYE_13575 [Nannocystaceae bacterium ST9]